MVGVKSVQEASNNRQSVVEHVQEYLQNYKLATQLLATSQVGQMPNEK